MCSENSLFAPEDVVCVHMGTCLITILFDINCLAYSGLIWEVSQRGHGPFKKCAICYVVLTKQVRPRRLYALFCPQQQKGAVGTFLTK